MKKFEHTPNFVKSRWDALTTKMGDLLDGCREFADLTIPHVLPPDDVTGTHKLTKAPLNSITARGISSLANKLQLILLPPNASFFKLNVDEQTLIDMGVNPDEIKTMMADINLQLSRVESESMRIIESSTLRKRLYDALVLSIITGNALLQADVNSNGSRVFSLLNYRLNRDYNGQVREIVVSEQVEVNSLDDDVRKQISEEATINNDDKFAEMLTYIHLGEDGAHHQFQEIKGVKVKGTDAKYPKGKSPWIPIRWSQRNNSDYGVGLIEVYIGSVRELEGYHKSSRDFITTASDIKFGIKQGSALTPRKLAALKSGEVIANADMGDVTELKISRNGELQIIEKMMSILKQELAQVFLLSSGNVRQAERVTAQEIRMLADEIDQQLGATYSLLSVEVQTSLVNVILSQTPSFSQLSDDVSFSITTGISAIGRNHDLVKIDEFVARISQTSPEAINYTEYAKRVASSLGINIDNLLKTPEQLQQEQMQQQGISRMGGMGASPDMMQQANDMVKASGGDINKMAQQAGIDPAMIEQITAQLQQ